jgi:hypothetical protein
VVVPVTTADPDPPKLPDQVTDVTPTLSVALPVITTNPLEFTEPGDPTVIVGTVVSGGCGLFTVICWLDRFPALSVAVNVITLSPTVSCRLETDQVTELPPLGLLKVAEPEPPVLLDQSTVVTLRLSLADPFTEIIP